MDKNIGKNHQPTKTRRFKKATAVGLILACLLLVFFPACRKKKSADFNVVLVVIDTVRSDHLPIYGYKRNTAPFLTELAQKAVVFENTFAAAPWTSPATASIFTSLYPFQHRVLMGLLAIRMAKTEDQNLRINKIPEEIDTIAEVMKRAGYKTFGISDNLNIGERQGFTQGFDRFVTYMYQKAPAVNATLKEWKPQMEKGGKYFLYIHYMDPHAPYHKRRPWYEPQTDRHKDLIAAHDSEIAFADMHLKELFHVFGWEKNTLLIVTSDHGEGLWDHGKMGHGNSLYREELQVPLVVYLPGGTTARRVSPQVSTIDILPTVRDLIGLPRDKNNQGLSLLPLIEGRDKDLGDRYFYPYLWKKVRQEIEFRAVIHQKWHFIRHLPERRELFNLIGDPKEQHNLYSQGLDIASQLEKEFNVFLKKCRKFKENISRYQLDEEKMKELKSLGYVE